MRSELDDLLDRLVAEYSDQLYAGGSPDPAPFLERIPEEHREALERSLRMIEAGLAKAPQSARPLAPGTELDGFKLVREVGRGGMSIVFLAQQVDLQRSVALKILRPTLALDANHLDRFRREALSIARLQHPNVLLVHGVGEAQGYHYIAMEYVEGKSLGEVIEALPRGGATCAEDVARAAGIPQLASALATPEEVFGRLLAPVAEALAAAHELGIVHRDVKPSNILLRKDGTPVVADFGLAKGAGDPSLSLTGDPLGTPYYMSPEQAGALERSVDHKTDVYSLGVTLYEALTKKRPFTGESAIDVLQAIRNKVPPTLRSLAPGVSKDAEAVIRRAMARQPGDRYEGAREFAEDLERLGERVRTQARLDEGGVFGRWRARRRFSRGSGAMEHKSETVILGLPLYHYYTGPRMPGQRLRVAKGWYAAGDIAIGGFAVGTIAMGLVAWAGLAVGLVAWGGLAIGGLVWAGMGLGGFVFAGISVGWLAFGGMALGYIAFGGMVRGVYVDGGMTHGPHSIRDLASDPRWAEFFDTWTPGLLEWIERASN